MSRFLFIAALVFFSNLALVAQSSTFGEVYNIFQAKCTGACHAGATPAGNLDLSGSEGDVYSRLVEQNPTNPAALAKGYKLVDQGYPARSFVYRKVNGTLYHDAEMEAAEGGTMPNYAPELPSHEKELIRQWILFGAPETGEVEDYAMLQEFYASGGGDRLERPAPPAPNDGFQLYLGSIFLAPNEEREYVYKYELQNADPIEINKLEVAMNQQSHHFLFFKFDDGEDADEDEGLELVTVASSASGDALAITSDTKMVGGWAYSNTFDLPEGTAYKWQENVVLKFNYHIKNYSPTLIQPIDLYVNVYTQPAGTAQHEMLSDFKLSNPLTLFLLPGEQNVTWNLNNFSGAGANDSVHLWLLGAHTHQYGTDFDVYKRNSDGSTGEQLYEGFYNFDYSFNQGYYDYAEPAMRIFDDFASIRAGNGLHMEATYNNTSGGLVTFGLTTEGEMFGLFHQFLVGDISDLTTGINEAVLDGEKGLALQTYPNPNTGLLHIRYQLAKPDAVSVSLHDITGKRLATPVAGKQQTAGAHTQSLNLQQMELPAGMYLIKLTAGTQILTRKITLVD